MTIPCPKCKTDNPDTLKFCGECGTQLIEAREAPMPREEMNSDPGTAEVEDARKRLAALKTE